MSQTLTQTLAQNHLRNIAIIARAAHGKTALVDGMLKEGLRALPSPALEVPGFFLWGFFALSVL